MYMKKGFKKLAVGSAVLAGAAALASAVSYFVTKNLLTVALDRKEPKAIGKSKEMLTGNPNIEETAKLLKLSESAVKMRLNRAREYVKSSYNKEDFYG